MKSPRGAFFALLVWTALVAVALLSPGGDLDGMDLKLPPWSDKVVHAGLFFGEALVLLAWLSATGRSRPRLRAALVAGLLAVLMETAQHWIPRRTSDPADLLANAVGILLLLAVSRLAGRPAVPGVRLTGVLLAAGLAWGARPLAAQVPNKEAPVLHAALVVRDGRVLARENADLPVTPASVQKLLTTALALHTLGPDHRFVTVLRAAGEVRDGVLDGDLVVVGGGDPTWSQRFDDAAAATTAADLAAQLRRRGIRRVQGDLLVDAAAFPGRPHPVSRSGPELAHAFSTPTSALAVDENCVPVRIAPGAAVGAPGRVEPQGRAARITWTNGVRTVGEERHERGTVDFLPVWGEARVVVRGEYPISEPPYTLCISVPDPAVHAAVALRDGLERAGVAFDGGVRRSDVGRSGAKVPGTVLARTVLARHVSPPLAEILPPILGRSHNWLAEMVLLQVALAENGEGRLDEALDLLERFLVEEVGAAPGSFVLDDGSGLSPHNLVSAATVVRLLVYARRQSWGDVFVAALPRPGQGTLRGWPALDGVRAAKTGTLRGTLALAGYGGARGDVVFAVFRNHVGEDRDGEQRAAVAAWLRGVLKP